MKTLIKKYKFLFTTWLLFQSLSLFSQTVFEEVYKNFPRQEKNLRKWDAPVIADLDRDGYNDLLINDHGYALQVQWNNKGKFEKPYDIIMGDLHGVSVGDIDKDRTLEIIISRGGGSGSNARNSKIYKVTKDRKFIELEDFTPPLAFMRGRTVAFLDGDNDGNLDLLNFAFPSAEKKGKTENYIYKNNGKGKLLLRSTLPPTRKNGQKTLITDFNNDNILDFLLYGEGTVKVFKGNGDLTYTEVSKTVLKSKIEDVTSIAEIDFDNDGDFDLFLTRAKEFKKGETFYDPKKQLFGFYTTRGKFQFEDLKIGEVLHLENFQSQWPNNDTYFIGETAYKYNFEGETHSGKDIRLVNSDALGFPDNINYKEKKGWYIGFVGNKKWRIAGYLWAPATGIVHGVTQYPETKHSKGLQDILLENENGKFKEVSKKYNILIKHHTVGVSVADFDNNGFQDLVIVRRGNLIHANKSILYLNLGDSGFRKVQDHKVISEELGAIGMAVETFDYNMDGKIDIVIGNERGKWHLFENKITNTSENNHLTVKISNSKSGKATALGALVEVKACKNSQRQRIGSTGAQYSLSHDTFAHFGLGSCQSGQIKVIWTNGETETKSFSEVNKIIKMGI